MRNNHTTFLIENGVACCASNVERSKSFLSFRLIGCFHPDSHNIEVMLKWSSIWSYHVQVQVLCTRELIKGIDKIKVLLLLKLHSLIQVEGILKHRKAITDKNTKSYNYLCLQVVGEMR